MFPSSIVPSVRIARRPWSVPPRSHVETYLAQHCANINIYLFVIIIKWCCSSLATTLIVVLIFRSLRHRAVRWRDHLAAGLAFRACIMMVCRLPSYDVCADLRRIPLILNRSIGEGLPTYKRKTITTVIQHGPGGLDLVCTRVCRPG